MATLHRLEADRVRAACALVADVAGVPLAVAEEKVIGPSPIDERPAAWVALDGDATVGVAVSSGRWLRLLAVAPSARRRGAGGALLAAAEADVSARGATRVQTLDQPGNYLAPGVPADDGEAIAWLERRSYARVAENVNLRVDVQGNPRVSAERAAEAAGRAAAAGYAVRRAAAADRAPLIAMIDAGFSPAWAFEVERALDRDRPDVHLATDATGAPVAFAAHDGNNRGLGWFGPAGTLPAHRGRRLGEALLLACLVDTADAGHARSTIAWIGPRDFYDRAAGITDERRFVVLAKELRP
jgi:mycothiol synthase